MVTRHKIFLGTLLLTLSLSGLAAAEGIQWKSYGEGLSRGKAEKKKIFIHFYADW